MRAGSCGEKNGPWVFGNVFGHDFPLLVLLPLEGNVWGAPCSGEDADLPRAGRGLGQSCTLTVTSSLGQIGAEVSTETSQHLLCPQNLVTGVTTRLRSG